ncbi:unnamed protein product [Schistosoma curassoni]|nr:unnamed protein product [Schistosoma curassoni]
MFVVTPTCDLNDSVGKLSGSIASTAVDVFPQLICLMTDHPDFFDRRWSDSCRNVCMCCLDVRCVHWSCSIQEFVNVFYLSVPALSCLSLIGLSGLLYFPACFLVAPYGFLIFACVTAFSTVVVRCSMYFFLSTLMLLFTCLFALCTQLVP